MTKKSLLLTFTCFICTVFILSCTKWENPYLNPNDSNAVFSALGVHDGDTVPIFRKDSIGIKIYLREHLSLFSISIKKNRYWTDTIVSSDNFDNNHIRFNFSFYDTGWHEIILSSHKVNGDSAAIQNFRIYASSPLKQNTLEIKAGDTVTLSTPKVSDDVFYVWDMHSITIKDFKSQIKQYFDIVPSSSVGEIYVIDRNNNRSPSSFFVIKEIKESVSMPEIKITNDSIISDTVFSSTPSIQIVGNIIGIASVKEFTINTAVIKTDKSTDGIYHFSQEFQNVDSLSPITLIMKAKDNLDNITQDTFFIKYLKNIINSKPVITIQNPSLDSTISNKSELSIFGQISNYDKYPSSAIIYTKNGNTQSGFTKLTGGIFYIPVKLETGRNSFIFKFIEDTISLNVLTSKEILVYYDPGSLDTTGPEIYVLYNNAELADNTLFRVSNLPLNILVQDISFIKSVTVNGTQAVLSADSINHLPTFLSVASLKHPENKITIIATDVLNNSSQIDYDSIGYNQLPVITGDFSTVKGFAGTPIVWKTIVTDNDNDSLIVTATVNGNIITLSPDSSIKWTPAVKDTGWHEVKIQAYDKHEFVDTTFTISVSNLINDDIEVKWITSAAAIPDSLVIGDDTLHVSLSANPLSNLRPFNYKVELTDIKKVLLDSNDSTLLWIPDSTDSGFHIIKFTITDSNNNKDEFTSNINIVKPTMPVIQFVNASNNMTEDSSTIKIPVYLSKASKDTITVKCEIIWHDPAFPMDALPGDYKDDYSRDLTFTPGDTIDTFELQVLEDDYPEIDEKIPFRLSNPSSNATLGSQTISIFTIIDDDYATFSFETSQGSGNEIEGGIDSVFVVVTLSDTLKTWVNLKCSIAIEYTTASREDDYLLQNASRIEFPPGKVKDSVLLLIQSSSSIENSEIVALKLSRFDSTLVVRDGSITLYKYTINGTKADEAFFDDDL